MSDDTVWVASNDEQTYHTDRDCMIMKKLDSDAVFEKSAEVMERSRRTVCQVCSGEHRLRAKPYDRSIYEKAKSEWE
jgi:hypothetical protein